MVNALHYSTAVVAVDHIAILSVNAMTNGASVQCLLSKALYNDCAIAFTHSHTHSYTDGRGNHARHQPAHWEKLGSESCSRTLRH